MTLRTAIDGKQTTLIRKLALLKRTVSLGINDMTSVAAADALLNLDPLYIRYSNHCIEINYEPKEKQTWQVTIIVIVGVTTQLDYGHLAKNCKNEEDYS